MGVTVRLIGNCRHVTMRRATMHDGKEKKKISTTENIGDCYAFEGI